jgi:3'-5' exoribonuclease
MEYSRLKDLNIRSLIGSTVPVEFLAGQITSAETKTKREYLIVKMTDSGVSVDAKIFEVNDTIKASLIVGQVYCGQIKVQEYPAGSGNPSCILESCGASTNSPTAFVNREPLADEAATKLGQVAAQMANTLYGKIAYSLLVKNWAKFCMGVAGTRVHHVGIGGLSTHTVEVLDIAEANAEILSARNKTEIDKDLLRAGAILHDIGKVHEIDVDASTGVSDYSKEAAITTHIMTGMAMIAAEAALLGLGESAENKDEGLVIYERNQIRQLLHCIASHHGRNDLGSPLEPATIEATLIHAADMASSKVNMLSNMLSEVGPNDSHQLRFGSATVKAYKGMEAPVISL